MRGKHRGRRVKAGERPPLDERRTFEVFARDGVVDVLRGVSGRLHAATRFTADFDVCPA